MLFSWEYQVSGIYPQSSGRQTRNLAIMLDLSADLILSLYYIFSVNVKFNFSINPYVVYIPQAKAWGFNGGVLITEVSI